MVATVADKDVAALRDDVRAEDKAAADHIRRVRNPHLAPLLRLPLRLPVKRMLSRTRLAAPILRARSVDDADAAVTARQKQVQATLRHRRVNSSR